MDTYADKGIPRTYRIGNFRPVLRQCLRTAMGGRVPRGEPKKWAPVGSVIATSPPRPGAHNATIIADLAMPVVSAPPGGRTWLRGVLVVGDRRIVGDPRTAVACAGQHGSPRRTTREALPPCDCGRHPVHRGRWYPVAATANGVPASRDDVGGVRPLGPQRSVAAHPRRAARPTAGAGRAGPLPDRGDHRLADATRPPTPCPIRPRLGRRQQNEGRQPAPRRGGERPAARRRRHRRLDHRPRRRTPTAGRTARQLLHHRAGLGPRRLPRTVAHLGERRSHPYYADHQTHPRRHWFPLPAPHSGGREKFRVDQPAPPPRATTKPDPTTT